MVVGDVVRESLCSPVVQASVLSHERGASTWVRVRAKVRAKVRVRVRAKVRGRVRGRVRGSYRPCVGHAGYRSPHERRARHCR